MPSIVLFIQPQVEFPDNAYDTLYIHAKIYPAPVVPVDAQAYPTTVEQKVFIYVPNGFKKLSPPQLTKELTVVPATPRPRIVLIPTLTMSVYIKGATQTR